MVAPATMRSRFSHGGRATDMPLFLSPEVYVPVPLEGRYQAAWETVPAWPAQNR